MGYRFGVVIICSIFLAGLSQTLRATDNDISLISVSSSGEQGNGDSFAASVSGDGRYIAFSSVATNLVPDDSNGSVDVFVRDTQTGTTTRVSVASDGAEANNFSYPASISADGRFVAFFSAANNIVPDDPNGFGGLFVHDLQTGTTTSVSFFSGGVQLSVAAPAISGDGRFVAFYSTDSTLVPNDTNSSGDVFVRDMQTGTTTLVSVSSSGQIGNGGSGEAAISVNGRFVVFHSIAGNLVPDHQYGWEDLYIHDMQTGITSLVTVPYSGLHADYQSDWPSVSSSGRYVAFESFANNLVPNDTNSEDVFVRDMQLGITTRISVSRSGAEGNNESLSASISEDGRYIAFESAADNLVPNDTYQTYDVFVHDMQTGETRLVSVPATGVHQNWLADHFLISADGRFIAFDSGADNLVSGDTNGKKDVFVASNVLYSPDPPNTAPSRNYFTVLPVTLTWTLVSNVIGYHVQVATDKGFAPLTIVKNMTIPANQLYVNITTIANGPYFWRVCGRITLTKCGAWSTPESFMLAVP